MAQPIRPPVVPNMPPVVTPADFPFPVIPADQAATSRSIPNSFVENGIAHRIAVALWTNEADRGTAAFKSSRQIADELHTSIPYLYSVRRRLAAKNAAIGYDPRPYNKSNARTGKSLEELLELAKNEPILSPHERLQIVSNLARCGNPAVKLQAVKTLEELSRPLAERAGPPAPLTSTDRVDRLARLLIAVGRTEVDAAHALAFPEVSPAQAKASPSPP